MDGVGRGVEIDRPEPCAGLDCGVDGGAPFGAGGVSLVKVEAGHDDPVGE